MSFIYENPIEKLTKILSSDDAVNLLECNFTVHAKRCSSLQILNLSKDRYNKRLL